MEPLSSASEDVLPEGFAQSLKGTMISHTQVIQDAADAIKAASYLLILAGAGFSADSGLETYENLPERYAEMCNPAALVQNERSFQQFWSFLAQQYGATHPHTGYDILSKWCEEKSAKKDLNSKHCLSHFWIYTSNVDGHFRRFRTFQNCITEIHGFAGEHMCSRGIGLDHEGHPRLGTMWSQWNADVVKHHSECCAGINGQPPLDATTLNLAQQGRHLCNCGLPVRPNILMFHDTDDNIVAQLKIEQERYQRWEARVEDNVVEHGSNLVILELGCGVKVPALRQEAVEVLQDTLERINLKREVKGTETASRSGTVKLIRINPMPEVAAAESSENTIFVCKPAEAALVEISRRMETG
jgi:NAD-dependent SIR2 family protein deacetylase